MEQLQVSWGDLMIAASVVVAAVGGVWRISAMFNKLINRLDHLDGRVKSLEDDEFGLAKMSELALRAAVANPSLNIPDPRNPTKIIKTGSTA